MGSRPPHVVTLETGKIVGSVRIIGTLPDTMSCADAGSLAEAIEVVRGAYRKGIATMEVTLALTEFNNSEKGN